MPVINHSPHYYQQARTPLLSASVHPTLVRSTELTPLGWHALTLLFIIAFTSSMLCKCRRASKEAWRCSSTTQKLAGQKCSESLHGREPWPKALTCWRYCAQRAVRSATSASSHCNTLSEGLSMLGMLWAGHAELIAMSMWDHVTVLEQPTEWSTLWWMTLLSLC